MDYFSACQIRTEPERRGTVTTGPEYERVASGRALGSCERGYSKLGRDRLKPDRPALQFQVQHDRKRACHATGRFTCWAAEPSTTAMRSPWCSGLVLYRTLLRGVGKGSTGLVAGGSHIRLCHTRQGDFWDPGRPRCEMQAASCQLPASPITPELDQSRSRGDSET